MYAMLDQYSRLGCTTIAVVYLLAAALVAFVAYRLWIWRVRDFSLGFAAGAAILALTAVVLLQN